MVEACEKHGVKFNYGTQRRYANLYHRMRELIDSGELGDVRAARELVGPCDALVHSAFYRPGSGFRGSEGDVVEFVERNGFWAVLLFGAVYAVVIAFSLPGGAAMTITGGFLFGWLGGGLIVVVGATIGATALFLVARTAIGGYLEAKAGPFLLNSWRNRTLTRDT